jgi:hypothetical protein
MQPAAGGDKRCAKGQTLNYLNGYAREEALREVRDAPEPDVAAAGALSLTSSPAKTMACSDSPNKLPKWVEMDRKVRLGMDATWHDMSSWAS